MACVPEWPEDSKTPGPWSLAGKFQLGHRLTPKDVLEAFSRPDWSPECRLCTRVVSIGSLLLSTLTCAQVEKDDIGLEWTSWVCGMCTQDGALQCFTKGCGVPCVDGASHCFQCRTTTQLVPTVAGRLPNADRGLMRFPPATDAKAVATIVKEEEEEEEAPRQGQIPWKLIEAHHNKAEKKKAPKKRKKQPTEAQKKRKFEDDLEIKQKAKRQRCEQEAKEAKTKEWMRLLDRDASKKPRNLLVFCRNADGGSEYNTNIVLELEHDQVLSEEIDKIRQKPANMFTSSPTGTVFTLYNYSMELRARVECCADNRISVTLP